MGRRLATAVHIEHPTTHELLILQPGEEPDEDVAEAITNPYAWEEQEAPPLDDPEPEPAPEPEAVPEPAPAAAPEKPAARARSRKVTGAQ